MASSTTPSEPRALHLRAGAPDLASPANGGAGSVLVAPVLRGLVEPLPRAPELEILWERLAETGPAFAFLTPDGEALAAFGSVARFEGSGPGRFQAARRWMEAVAAAASIDTRPAASDGAPRGQGRDVPPVAVGGFSFVEGSAGSPAGFGDAVFFVPSEVWWIGARPRRCVWSRVEDADRAAQPPALARPALPEWTQAEWTAGVRAVLARIEEGAIEKAVLARAVAIECPDRIEPALVFRSLVEGNPECYRFFMRPSADTAFVGASPERLVSLREGGVVSDAVAGTAADAALLTSTKDRSEHDFVVRHILDSLAPLTVSLRADAEPSLQRHRRLTHLRTRVVGEAKPGVHVLDLVERVHPTPAVAGSPPAAALELIRSLEPSHRGWYAGAVGWMSGSGEGDFAVGIRSALLHDRRAVLFAGAGIVPGSDPAAEWAETEVKLSIMREAIADAGR